MTNAELELVGKGRGKKALSCCSLGIPLLIVVEANGLGLVWVDWEGVLGCALMDREGLGMWLGLELWLGKWVLEDVLLYGSDVLSCPAILMLALGLYVVTTWGRCSVNDGLRD